MFASRASAEPPLARRARFASFGAVRLHESWLVRDARWIMAVAFLYALAVLAAVLTLNRYFSQTWDVTTFAHAARSLLNGASWTALYAQSRADAQWPYAYPPLHAAVLAPLLALSSAVPDWLWARLPPLLADIGVGLLLYALVARKTLPAAQGRAEDRTPARLALVVWLLNPVTFYDTAVQGHFEAEWLFFVLLAYAWAQARRGVLLPTLALAAAFLFKQVAILFAVPYWAFLLFSPEGLEGWKRGGRVLASGVLFALAVLLVSLPFLLHSNDYLYMNWQYVASVPLQTQSWLVALAGLTSPQFVLIQHSTVFVALAALALSVFAARRGASLYLTAVLIALAFFLLSQKVMGYYYVMLLPFALVEFIPARRFRLLTLMVASIAWISLSPYAASWTEPAHWPLYAALGTLNSLLWLALLVRLGWERPHTGTAEGPREVRTLAFVSVLLFTGAVAAALLQPLIQNPVSAIRAPVVPDPLRLPALAALMLLVLAALAAALVLARGKAAAVPRGAWVLAFLFLPLYFLTFTLTKESTAFVEIALKSFGL